MEKKSQSERHSNADMFICKEGGEVIFPPDSDDDFTSSDEKKTVSQSALNETNSTGTERSRDLERAISGLATKKDLEEVAGRLTAIEDIKSTVDGLLKHEDFERTVGRLATQKELEKAAGRLSAVEDIKSTVDGLLKHEDFERTIGRLATQEDLKKAVGRLSAVEDIKSTVDGLLKHEDFENAVGRLATQKELKKAVGSLSAVEDIKNTVDGLLKHEDFERTVGRLATQEDFNAAIDDLSSQISNMKDGADEEIKNAVQNGMVDFAKIGLLSVAQEELRKGILQALSPEGSITIAAKDQVQEGIKYYDETLLSIIATLDVVNNGLQTVDNNINDHSTQINKNIESGTAQAAQSINALNAHIDKQVDTCCARIEKHSDACVTQINKHIDDCCVQADKHFENCNAHIADNNAKLESISEKLDVNRSKKWEYFSALNISYVAICIFCCLLAGIGYFMGIVHTQLLIVALLLATIPLLVVFLSNVVACIYNAVKTKQAEDKQNDKMQSSDIQANKCGIVRIVYHSVCCAMALANVVLACLIICEIGGLNLVA